ncbi:ParA family protein [Streptomyces sp. OF3]|uniref:ParA family protein n=1 Tax=Streptomyces alkaliterrae TaxID=2213162 RepID=A0A7W3WHR4_9ACTN|nr:ParA family protein [Streptomyces alkaliterrae]MBB1252547.1 ParA family protein [Streptomyces alkaliterrae]
MASPPAHDREKVVSKMPGWLRQELKVRTAQLGLEIQAAVEQGIAQWSALASSPKTVDTAGADPFSTWLPQGQWEAFKTTAASRQVSLTQGLAQAVQVWLDSNPSPAVKRPDIPRRVIVCNQKGGVGKTAVTAGVGEALAESSDELYPVRISRHLAAALEQDEPAVSELPGLGLRVLLVDFDPQAHLTKQLGQMPLSMDGDSLTKHMAGEPAGKLADLIVPIESGRFGDRLYLLPSCNDAFLLDVKLAGVRAREAALERALAPVEGEFDVILVDCPPSLGLSMDAAVHYGRRREGEAVGQSGVLIVVQAEDSSADAYDLLTSQIEDLRTDLALELDYLGIVVNHYDARRGFIATSSLRAWMDIRDPKVVGLIGDLKEQKEAVRLKEPLLDYAPRCDQALSIRALAREIS